MEYKEIQDDLCDIAESAARRNGYLRDIKENLDQIRKMVKFFYVLTIVIIVLWFLALIIYGPAVVLWVIGQNEWVILWSF